MVNLLLTYSGKHSLPASSIFLSYDRMLLPEGSDMDYALVDREANSGICGTDMLDLEGSERFVDVVGLTEHKINQL
jgi:hypothetical protein